MDVIWVLVPRPRWWQCQVRRCSQAGPGKEALEAHVMGVGHAVLARTAQGVGWTLVVRRDVPDGSYLVTIPLEAIEEGVSW